MCSLICSHACSAHPHLSCKTLFGINLYTAADFRCNSHERAISARYTPNQGIAEYFCLNARHTFIIFCILRCIFCPIDGSVENECRSIKLRKDSKEQKCKAVATYVRSHAERGEWAIWQKSNVNGISLRGAEVSWQTERERERRVLTYT